MAHADSFPGRPGANDNASGVGLIVALASRLARAGGRPPCDVWLVVTGSEERGVTGRPDHLGAQALVRRVTRLRRRSDLRIALSLDEVGRGGRFFLQSPHPRARPRVEELVLAAARDAHATVRFSPDSATGNSDHREFELSGLPAAKLGPWQGAEPCRHTACDTWDRLDRGTLDAALRIAAGGGTLSFADGLVRSGDGSLAFVPDSLLGDDPDEVKRGLREALWRLLQLDFDNLLFAHGQPLAGGGKQALRDFLEAG
jgi:hypothetical protein